jgi:ADP-ribosylation factor-like protein 3
MELSRLIAEEDKLAGVPLLVFANKQDLLSALSAADISIGLSLHTIKDRTWQIQACSAKTGEGLQEGLEWLVKTMGERQAAAAGGSGAAVPSATGTRV